MAAVDVLNLDGEVTGSVDLPSEIFAVEPSQSAIYYALKAHLTNRRQGNASTKTRSEVTATGRKLYRQKGTGRARMGGTGSPVRVGGGVAHGPRPRALRERVPKKLRRLAIRSAFSLKAAADEVKVLVDFSLDAPKTSRMAGMARSIDVADKKALLLTAEPDSTIHKSCRNIQRLAVLPVSQASAYDVVEAETVIFTQGALDRAQELWGAR